MNKESRVHHNKVSKPLHSRKMRWTIIIVFSLIVITFIGAPLLTYNINSNPLSFGSYNGKEISYQENNLFGYIQRFYANQYANTGRSSSSPEISKIVLQTVWRSSFDQTVLARALIDAAQKSGYYRSDYTTKKSIIESPVFQVDGVFSIERYNALSLQEQQNILTTEREVQLADAVQKDFMYVPYISTFEQEFFQEMNTTQHKFSFVRFPIETPQKEVVINYAKDNAQLFSNMEIQQMSFSSKSLATQALSQIQEGLPFEEIAKENSEDQWKEEGGIRGKVYAYDLKNEISDAYEAVFSLAKDENSEVIAHGTNNTFIIYHAISEASHINEDTDFDDADIYDNVLEYMRKNVRDTLENAAELEAESFIANTSSDPTSFEDYASEKDLEYASTEYFPINYGDISFLTPLQSTNTDISLQEISQEEDLLIQLFSLNTESPISESIVLGNFTYVFLLQDVKTTTDDAISEETITTFIESILNEQLKNTVVKQALLRDNFNTTFESMQGPSQ